MIILHFLKSSFNQIKNYAEVKLRVTADPEVMHWALTDVEGIDRKMMELDGAETARATSLMRYASSSGVEKQFEISFSV